MITSGLPGGFKLSVIVEGTVNHRIGWYSASNFITISQPKVFYPKYIR